MTERVITTLCCAALAIIFSGCSRLEVRTEAYIKGHDHIQDQAIIIGRSLSELEALLGGKKNEELFHGGNETVLKADLAEAWNQLRKLGPNVYAGDADGFSATFWDTVTKQGPHSLSRKRIRELQRLAEQLGNRDKALFGDSRLLYERSRELKKGYREIVEKVNGSFNKIVIATKKDSGGSAIRDYYFMSKADWDAAQQAGASTALKNARTALVNYTGNSVYDQAIANLNQTSATADQILDALIDTVFPSETELLEDFSAVDENLAVLPLADPLVPRIVSAPDESWEGVYNHVLGKTWFGNSEIAIRMENLGEFHIKGVVFDASKVTKATVEGLHSAVQIVGAAFGLPISEGSTDGSEEAPTISRASLRAQIHAVRGESQRRVVTKAEGFYDLLGQLQQLPPTGTVQTDAMASILDALANRLSPPVIKENE